MKYLVAIFLIAILGSIFFLSTRSSHLSSSTRPIVATSFFPLAEFARGVGGEDVDVLTITPNGTEPHEYEPTPEQVASLYRADVFLYNGQGIDAWADRIASDLRKKAVKTLELSTIETPFISNPHVWLNPLLVQTYVQALADVLKQRDPAHAKNYQRNADVYHNRLQELDQRYREALISCSHRTVVTSHDAFAHVAMLYHFNVISIAGLSPEGEPSAGELAQIARSAKEQNVKYIFFETLASPKLSETLAKEIGAQTLVFNPIEGLTHEEQTAGKTYFDVMEENLKSLKTAMVCP